MVKWAARSGTAQARSGLSRHGWAQPTEYEDSGLKNSSHLRWAPFDGEINTGGPEKEPTRNTHPYPSLFISTSCLLAVDFERRLD